MAEEIAFENGRISKFEGLVTLTLDWVIRSMTDAWQYAVWRLYCIPSCIIHRSLPICQISLKLKELCRQMDGRTRMYRHLRPALLGRHKNGSCDPNHNNRYSCRPVSLWRNGNMPDCGLTGPSLGLTQVCIYTLFAVCTDCNLVHP